MQKLTKTVVEAAEPRARDYILWDSKVTGFGVRISPKGRRTYLLRFRNKRGADCKAKIGVHGPAITCDVARKIAEEWVVEIAKGFDPSHERRKAKAAPKMQKLYEEYMAKHAPKKKSKSLDDGIWKNHILPRLGKAKAVIDVTTEDVAAMHEDMRHIPVQANRAVALVSKAMGLAEKWGWRPEHSNPAKGIERYSEKGRKRYLTYDELVALSLALKPFSQSEVPVERAFAGLVLLLILTGARLREIMTARRVWIDGDFLRLPDSKGRLNSDNSKKIYLPARAQEIIAELPRVQGNPFLIIGRRKGRHLVNPTKMWNRLMDSAQIDDFTRHDLRHSFGSFGLATGLQLAQLGKLLGHKSYASTQRYAHLLEEPHKAFGKQVGDAVSSLMAVGEEPRRAEGGDAKRDK